MQEIGGVGSIPSSDSPGGESWHPTPVFLLRKSHGQRSVVSYSPWDCKELVTTEQLHSLCLCYEGLTYYLKLEPRYTL